MGFVSKVIGIAVLGGLAWIGYDGYQAGKFDLPELPDGAYTVSFKNGLRGIVLDSGVNPLENGPRWFRELSIAVPDRKFLGVPVEIEPWFEGHWSWCNKPTQAEIDDFTRNGGELAERMNDARFEAICRIDVDGKEKLRGLLFSVPKA